MPLITVVCVCLQISMPQLLIADPLHSMYTDNPFSQASYPAEESLPSPSQYNLPQPLLMLSFPYTNRFLVATDFPHSSPHLHIHSLASTYSLLAQVAPVPAFLCAHFLIPVSWLSLVPHPNSYPSFCRN